MLLMIENISKVKLASQCHLALLLVNSLIDILMCCIINMVASEQLRNRIVQDADKSIRYLNQVSDSSGEESSDEEREAAAWLDDDLARRLSFERKMDNATHRNSFERRGVNWEIAG
jgi:hypothetical protein